LPSHSRAAGTSSYRRYGVIRGYVGFSAIGSLLSGGHSIGIS
jgi:hypothetical protein